METLEDWIESLRKTDKLVIVEGKKDKKALENIGVEKIITISNKSLLYLEQINDKEVIILTDLDSHGKKLYSKIKNNLQKRGIKTDHKFREFLFKKTKITFIESINL